MNMSPDEQFLADWEILGTFGAVPGTTGVTRQAGSAEDGEQRRWFAELLGNNGFTVHRDAIGNQFGLLERVPGAPYVLVGSHLDSQPTAGRFDGAYGVLAGAHACMRVAERLASESDAAPFNLAVVNWFNEEGSRFKPSMMGSAVFTGKLPLETALDTQDAAGTTVREAMTAIDELGDFSGVDVAAYAEIHVQQGKSMERDGVTIGLVNATWAAHKYEFRVTGEQSHSGATEMADRRDALLAASRIIVAAADLVDEFEPGQLHSACGEIHVYPNSPVVVASEVTLLVDLRSPSAEVIRRSHESLMKMLAEIERRDRVTIEVIAEHSWDQQPYTPAGVELAREVAQQLNLTHDEVLTIAGHDSTNMNDVVPTIMLFVPSVQGISHNTNEFTNDEDLLAGLEHLTGVVEALARGALTQSTWATASAQPRSS